MDIPTGKIGFYLPLILYFQLFYLFNPDYLFENAWFKQT